MKRRLTSISAPPPLPDDVLPQILPLAYGYAPLLSTVCRTWNRVIEQYDGWFALAMQYYYYRKHGSQSRIPGFFHTVEMAPLVMRREQHMAYGGGSCDDPDTVVASIHDMLDSTDNPQRTAWDMLRTTQAALQYLQYYHVGDNESRRFTNFIGRLLVAKYPRYGFDAAMSALDAGRKTFVECRWLQQVVRYVQSEAANSLARRNFHPRDLSISFREEGHRYTLVLWDEETQQYINVFSHVDDNDDDGDEHGRALSYDEQDLQILRRDLRSQTTFIKCLHEEFDADQVLAKLRSNERRWNDPVQNAKYYGKTDEEIKQEWEANRVDASTRGTAMHLTLENKALGRQHETQSREYQLYMRYEAKHVVGLLRPFRAEWMVWDAELMLCGSIDIVYEYIDADGKARVPGVDGKRHLVIGDYKRSKEIVQYNPYQSMSADTLAFYAGDCNYVHYTIQLCGYKYMLERNYDVVVDGMYLIVLHPDQRDFVRIEVAPPEYRDQCERMMQSIWDFRRRQLRENARKWASMKELVHDVLV